MRYSSEPKTRKYVKGYSFLSFARKFGDKYGKKLMDTATKTGIDAAKTASKRVIQKTAEATEWYGKTRVTSHELRVASDELRVTNWKLKSTSWNLKAQVEIQTHEFRVQIHELRVRIHELRVRINKLRVRIHELRVWIHEFKNH